VVPVIAPVMLLPTASSFVAVPSTP
jgi:hypothetical protein